MPEVTCDKCKPIGNILADCWPAWGYTCISAHYEYCKKHTPIKEKPCTIIPIPTTLDTQEGKE